MNKSDQSRRSFLKKVSWLGSSLAMGLLPFPSFSKKSSLNNVYNITEPLHGDSFAYPTPAQLEWQDCEVGVIFHFDISVATEHFDQSNNSYREVFDPQNYNPKKLDTDQWIQAAKDAGAGYAVFTATHFCGFMQWQSDLYPYGLKQAKWRNGKGDIVEDFVRSCHKAGIKPAIYLSTHRNAYWHVDNHYVNWGKGKGTKKQAEFNRVAEQMVQELCSRYGPLVEIWFDAGVKTPAEGGPDVLPIVEKYQPQTVFYSSSQRAGHRWIGNEAGHADYPCWATMPGGYPVSHNAPSWRPILGTGDPDGSVWSPGMVDVPLRGANGIHSWFWKPGQADGVYSPDQLTTMYEQSVGHNCNFIIGATINPDGRVPDNDRKHLANFGNEIKQRYEKPIAETKGVGQQLTLKLKELEQVNQIILLEQIEFGERVRSFTIEGHTKDQSWMKIDEGISIGHKYIGKIKTNRVSAIRLTIHESVKTPVIRKFAVYQV